MRLASLGGVFDETVFSSFAEYAGAIHKRLGEGMVFDLREKKSIFLLIVFTFAAWLGMMGMLLLSEKAPAGTVLRDNALQLVACDPYSTIIDRVKASVVTLTATGRGPRAAVPGWIPRRSVKSCTWPCFTAGRRNA